MARVTYQFIIDYPPVQEMGNDYIRCKYSVWVEYCISPKTIKTI